MRFIPTSAHETFTARGYSSDEGARIRGFLPRRFGDINNALPLTNIDFWLAYDCVKHYNDNSKERGRFYSTGPIDFQSNSTVEYRSSKLNERFSMPEFIRHFGDILFTDFNQDLGMKVARFNPDGSLVVKNRVITTRLTAIEKQANEKPEDGYSWGNHQWLDFPVGKLHLPPKGMLTAKTVLEACTHGALACEWANLGDGRRFHPMIDFKQVATYLYLLSLRNKQDRRSGDVYENKRSTITMNLAFRSSQSIYPSDIILPMKAFHIDGTEVMTEQGIVNHTPAPLNYNTGFYPELYRYNEDGAVRAVPTIPRALFSEFEESEWLEALA